MTKHDLTHHKEIKQVSRFIKESLDAKGGGRQKDLKKIWVARDYHTDPADPAHPSHPTTAGIL